MLIAVPFIQKRIINANRTVTVPNLLPDISTVPLYLPSYAAVSSILETGYHYICPIKRT